ncbi:AtpZ/AtpI family protein [Marimonas arenosa]|uniref:AtpZ/AtpI family protein n=1 Tax=Marimonas arenosa TaxID=1795305 RepID=A0AAE3WA27_9RHOB|nr:AtpZ/AtpI family protein [Marimonas arenosa]MDQ2088944.1 AtpZ/AtpI family protein [Marimonas arenosa]
MTQENFHKTGAARTDSNEEISRRAKRKLAAKKRRARNPFYGLGMFGLVGWSVAIPTLAGTALGLWIDAQAETERSWTLIGLLAGVTLGCFNAWYWISKESGDE